MHIQVRMKGWFRPWVTISVFWIGYFAYQSVEAYSLMTSTQEGIIRIREEGRTIASSIKAIIPQWSEMGYFMENYPDQPGSQQADGINSPTRTFIHNEQQKFAGKIASGCTIEQIVEHSNLISKIDSLDRHYGINRLDLSVSLSRYVNAKNDITKFILIGLSGPCVLIIFGFFVVYLYKWNKMGFVISKSSPNPTPIESMETKECNAFKSELSSPVEENIPLQSEHYQDRQSQAISTSQPSISTPGLGKAPPNIAKKPLITSTTADADYSQTGVIISSFVILFCGLLTMLFFKERHLPGSNGATSNPGIVDLAIGISLLVPKFRNTSMVFAIFRAWAGVILSPVFLFMSGFSAIAVIGYWLLSVSLLLLLFKSKQFHTITKNRITCGTVLSVISVICVILAPIISFGF